MKKAKIVRRIIAAMLASCLAVGCTVVAYAEKSKSYGSIKKIIKIINQIERETAAFYFSDDIIVYNEDENKVYPYTGMDELPRSYDLRNVDGKCYVTEVKSQSPFGVCWTFGATAAAEISIATALDIDLNTATEEQKKAVDLSEHHIIWFSFMPVPENDPKYPEQAGEGLWLIDLDYSGDISSEEQSLKVMDNGGMYFSGAYLFSLGIGPALESDVPFISKEGYYYNICVAHMDEEYYAIDEKVLTEGFAKDFDTLDNIIDEYEKNYMTYEDLLYGDIEYDPDELYLYTSMYKDSGDWSVDESKRYISAYRLNGFNILPSPSVTAKDGSYHFNDAGVYAIKKALYSGHGVCTSIYGDISVPGQVIDPENCFMKFSDPDGHETNEADAAIWAQYAFSSQYDPSDPDSINACLPQNHTVAIVGYDDDFPKEYFNDPKGIIGGNGAFIIKNSWGSTGNSDPFADSQWGNGGDGYFYISYYDQSYDNPIEFIFDKGDEAEVVSLDEDVYDLCINKLGADIDTTDYNVSYSNVFTADENEFIERIGATTNSHGCTVDYAVYVLNEGFKDPTDGVKITEGSTRFDYKGYHVIDLDRRVPIKKGQSYSVVISNRKDDGQYCLSLAALVNCNGASFIDDYFRKQYVSEYGTDEGYVKFNMGQMAVVNPGESFLGVETKKGMEWEDLSDLIATVTSDNRNILNDGLNYDNFCIRAYPQTEIISAENVIRDEKESYSAGDVVKGRITITNNGTKTLRNVELTLNLGKIGKGNKLGKISRLAPGESKTIKYTYKVKAKDVRKGSVTSKLSVSVGGKAHKVDAQVYPLSFTVDTVR